MKKLFHIFAITAVLLTSCSPKQQKEDESNTYPLLTVTLSDETLNTGYAATLEGLQLVEIRPQVSGLVTKICINEGDKVHRGQLLFVIDQVPYQAALQVAQANVKSAEAQLATAKLKAGSNQMLFEKEVISDFELQTSLNALASAEAAYAQAQAQVTTASNNLSYTEVRSPVNGCAGMIPYRVGALVSSSISTPLVTVSDDSGVYAYFSLTENQMLDLMQEYGSQDAFLKKSPDVELTLSNGDPYPQTGRIDAVSGIVDQSTGSLRVRALFPNDSHLLRSGASATVMVPAHLTGCIAIPQTATFEIQEKVFVYKVVDGKACSQAIRVHRLNDGTKYIVEEGLSEGDVIISKGAGLVKEGALVEVAQ